MRAHRSSHDLGLPLALGVGVDKFDDFELVVVVHDAQLLGQEVLLSALVPGVDGELPARISGQALAVCVSLKRSFGTQAHLF